MAIVTMMGRACLWVGAAILYIGGAILVGVIQGTMIATGSRQ